MSGAVERFLFEAFRGTLWRVLHMRRADNSFDVHALLSIDEKALQASVWGPAELVERVAPRHPDGVLAKMRAREQRHRTRFRPGRARVRF